MRHKIHINNNHIIMITTPLNLHTTFIFFFLIIIINFILFFSSVYALNLDGTTLLSFKQSQPSSLLQNWNHTDSTPCSWSGVTCAPHSGSVISLVLPSTNLVGSIPNEFARLQHLRVLDLSSNSINGTLPISLYNMLRNLQVLNLSHNYLFGSVPSGFDSIQILDLSSNLFSGTMPLDFGGFKLNYFNLSNNKISGFLFPEFADKIPANAVVDLSYNNFRGEIPQTESLSKQKEDNFAGNLDLCGKPLKKTCIVPSSHSIPPNVSSVNPATAAIAAIPKTAGKSNSQGGRKVDKGKIVAIVAGDVAAVVLLAVVFLYGYRIRKKKANQDVKETLTVKIDESKTMSTPSTDKSTYLPLTICCCFFGTEEETICCCFFGTEEETETEYESVANSDTSNNTNTNTNYRCLVMVDGETELEMETLLKSSAYILGSSGGNIVYKAVVCGGSDGGGTAFAVRRIAECGVKNMKEFEKIVRNIGKFRHQNLVTIRGFYWGEDEKLVIHNYISGGSLAASATNRKNGYSLCNLSFEVRLKIAKGIAKGLAYIHDKKHVHGNIKPTNILLTSEMDPMIGDFGLDWLISGKPNLITNKSHEETMTSRDHHHHHENNSSSTSMASSTRCLYGHTSPYKAPESMKILKPNPKWDVYSFGIILLELLLGKMVSDKELGKWNMGGSMSDNETKILKIVDRFVTSDVVRKECILACFKLGFSCASATSHKRPSMKEALQVLERVSCSPS